MILVGVLCTYNAKADSADCPAGCFCLGNGTETTTNIQSYGSMCDDAASKAGAVPKGSGCVQATYGSVHMHSRECTNVPVIPDYYFDDFSEYYSSNIGFYGFLNNEFLYFYSIQGLHMFTCPDTFPESDPGAKALTECFKYNPNGTKAYYGADNYSNCNIDGIRATVENLQHALAEAAENLQNALNGSSPRANVNSVSLPINTTKSSKNVGKSAIPKATTMKAAKTLK